MIKNEWVTQLYPNDKKLTEADHKFLNETIAPRLEGRKPDGANWEVRNPSTDVSHNTNALIRFIILFVYGMTMSEFSIGEMNRWNGVKPSNVVSKFDRARMIVLKLEQRLYMDILD